MSSRAAVLLAAACIGQPFGEWKLNPARSTFAGDVQPKSFTVRIEPRVNGEVVTLDRTETNGQMTTSSSVLYLDGLQRDFQQGECSGKQSSRRIDSQTIEILRHCGGGAWIKFIRRTGPKTELVLDVTEQRADGRRFVRRLVFEKQ